LVPAASPLLEPIRRADPFGLPSVRYFIPRLTTIRSMPFMKFVYTLLIAFGLVAMYAILNAGNPDSLLRSLFPDPSWDVTVAMVSSLIVFVLGFVVFFNRDSEGFRNLIELNGERIREMRAAGHSDEEIADSILEAMGSRGGYRHKLTRKKLVVYLAQYT